MTNIVNGRSKPFDEEVFKQDFWSQISPLITVTTPAVTSFIDNIIIDNIPSTASIEKGSFQGSWRSGTRLRTGGHRR